MQLLKVLTINEERRDREDLLEFLEEAFDYFPEGVWAGIKYLGNIDVKYDLKIKSKEGVYGAFIFNHIMNRIRELKSVLNAHGLLLVVTYAPVIEIYYRFELKRFERIINLVHDYVSKEVGILSLFEIEDEKTATRVTAHGLGHNQGLQHHTEPVGLMYAGLLCGHPVNRNGFCDECRRKITQDH